MSFKDCRKTAIFKYYIVLQSITMESVSVKFQEEILKKIDKCIHEHNFNGRTEFIREAVRDKLSDVEKRHLITELMKLRGSVKTRTTDAKLRKIREQASEELLNKLEHHFSKTDKPFW